MMKQWEDVSAGDEKAGVRCLHVMLWHSRADYQMAMSVQRRELKTWYGSTHTSSLRLDGKGAK